MVRYLLCIGGLGVLLPFWVAADLSVPTRAITGGLMIGSVLVLSWLMGRRARRMRSELEGHPPQMLSHDGDFMPRRGWKKGKDVEVRHHGSW
jgi:hypothetical protein